MTNKVDNLGRLQEIIEELKMLGGEAKYIMRECFPDSFETADSYDVFNFSGSMNPYDTTFESCVQQAADEEMF